MDITSITYGPNAIMPPVQGAFRRGPSAVQPVPRTSAGTDATKAFADDVVKRLLASPSGETTETADTATPLAAALAQSMDFIRANYGDTAAQASMATVLKRIGSGDANEDALGQGLLDVLRLVDRNYGFAEGDRLMSQFNGELNDAVNAHFDNGLMEKFYAAGQSNPVARAVPAVVDKVLESFGEKTAEGAASILRDSLDQNLSPSSLRKGLGRIVSLIARHHGKGAAAKFSDFANSLLDGGETAPSAQQNAPATGALLDIAV
ncbi:hypothetical protein GGQ74_001294 [Desulfobaculum xiamenense]|uniref:Uncharacterized protein n=1 Tax=Desulfobaculum xiamenense TaxID=995050 RepID=A0A846QR25_9BACT|nr:hypothetical protein [Desulfobaculum xiamenense]NJB67654.1 hypothetical protein [Desulfobaculum xiamenense]